MINNNNINSFIDRYIKFADKLGELFNYDDNIKHLLYVIIPAFVVKYGLDNEQTIIDCFENTMILIGKRDNVIEAFFDRELYYKEKYNSYKYVVINGMIKDNYIELIDSIIHEFNHAINSINNEIKTNEHDIFLRTGISYVKYSRDNIKIALEKSKDYVLEEVINTKQSEEILTIMRKFSEYNIENKEFSNFLTIINKEIGEDKYKSRAYLLETETCKKLLENKTFFSTLEKLRLKGDIEGISNWFDNITGEKHSYDNLIEGLHYIYELEGKYKNVIFKRHLINKIKKKISVLERIIEKFDHNCIYK